MKSCLIIVLGVIILLTVLSYSIVAGFALIFGLCIGSLGEKLKWWDNEL